MKRILALLRPHQWAKNAFVLAPVLFARAAHEPAQLLRGLAAAGLFCLAASAVYAANDVLDAPRDRIHPKKRFRPVASGDVPVPVAIGISLVLAAGALGGAWVLGPAVLGILLAYVVLNLLYSVSLKSVVILDAICIAVSFVLRVLAGAAAINVRASHWLLLCTLLLALYLAFSKRRAELRLLTGNADEHRATLTSYTPELLDRFDSILLGATVVAYALYTVAPETTEKFGSDRLIYGLPFVIYGLFRFLFLVENGADSGEPGSLALRDGPLVLCVALWVVFNAVVIYAR
jgi:4-hydroxybenzoate polyprenyltransferase